ncbi:class I SAM-dependent methyltransferase [Parasphingorhabdus halotolerans]|uniref:Class I SAM-dependent methyltransferase n=1 Tax=Parasphingorhabdus halotolerans TaxID=2725558 RepID=A0A6H2DLT2_9SPHN|nr:class I SAM-dependent methyltransferase [Parasphingorhabdus halotolerans]QJB68616.1 class I SAM-dependent methyltransferase [Parasphingorhabdus halotolerans]
MERLNVADDLNGWVSSADAWIASIGEDGDWTRRTFLDAAMLGRAKVHEGRFLDIGCGEGRFARKLQEFGFKGVGIDPVDQFIKEAQKRDPDGDYRIGIGEKLTFEDASFDLTISYLSLIDIEDFRAAIKEMTRVTKPGGSILVANLTGHFTAGKWERGEHGDGQKFVIDNYHEERANREVWSGIDVINWHRPMSAYLEAFLTNGLILRHFFEPTPPDQNDPKSDRYTRVPGFVVMEWEKPKEMKA